MWVLAGLAILAVLLVPLVISVRRSTELFVLRVERGRALFVRGRIPQRLLDDIADVVRRAKVPSGEIKAVVEGGSPRVVGRGVGDGTLQQVRNVVGSYQVAQIRAGGRPQ